MPEALRNRLTRGALPIDWNRIASDYDQDEVYVSDGVYSLWRFDGNTGEATLLKTGGKIFFAADLAVGYDGLLYVRKCAGYTPGISDFSGPFERYGSCGWYLWDWWTWVTWELPCLWFALGKRV